MSRLAELLQARSRPVVTGELAAIDSGGLAAVAEQVHKLAPYVDAINATDNPAAHAHASNVAIAIAIKNLGCEPILQVVCRDKNRLAIQADIVGAALFGVENVCALTGDDVSAGDEPGARRVFDLDAPQLISVATTLGQGRYLSGRKIEPAPTLFIGAVENPSAPPLEYRVARAGLKSRAGARFLQLQIGYHPERLSEFVAGCVDTGITEQTALLPTICLTRSARALRFMDEKVPGISVPKIVIDRVESATDQAEAAYQLAREQAEFALSLPGVSGIHIANFRHDNSVGRLVTDLSLPIHDVEEQHAHGSQLAG